MSNVAFTPETVQYAHRVIVITEARDYHGAAWGETKAQVYDLEDLDVIEYLRPHLVTAAQIRVDRLARAKEEAERAQLAMLRAKYEQEEKPPAEGGGE